MRVKSSQKTERFIDEEINSESPRLASAKWLCLPVLAMARIEHVTRLGSATGFMWRSWPNLSLFTVQAVKVTFFPSFKLLYEVASFSHLATKAQPIVTWRPFVQKLSRLPVCEIWPHCGEFGPGSHSCEQVLSTLPFLHIKPFSPDTAPILAT